MTDAYRVTAPYVTLRVSDPFNGGWSVRGFHVGAVLSPDSLHAEDLARHLRKGMVEKFDIPAPAPEPAPEPEKPKKSAPAKAGD